jgi:hypothetical protein
VVHGKEVPDVLQLVAASRRCSQVASASSTGGTDNIQVASTVLPVAVVQTIVTMTS